MDGHGRRVRMRRISSTGDDTPPSIWSPYLRSKDGLVAGAFSPESVLQFVPPSISHIQVEKPIGGPAIPVECNTDQPINRVQEVIAAMSILRLPNHKLRPRSDRIDSTACSWRTIRPSFARPPGSHSRRNYDAKRARGAAHRAFVSQLPLLS